MTTPTRCEHRWRFVGRAKGVEACDRPTVMACATCGERSEWRCRSSSKALCGPCSMSYRRTVRTVARSGVNVPTGVVFLTVTAPSEHEHVMPSGDTCPCSRNAGPLGEWNAKAGQLWSWLVLYLRRHVDASLQYFRATEVQERGALHFHAIMRFSPSGLRKLRAMWRPRDPHCPLRSLVVSRGFGHSIDLQVLDSSPSKLSKLTNYVAKYVSKAVDARHDVPWTPPEAEGTSICRATYRTWSATRAWGQTMGELRRAQVAFMRSSGSTPSPAYLEGRGVALPLDPNTDRYTSPEAVRDRGDPYEGKTVRLVALSPRRRWTS